MNSTNPYQEPVTQGTHAQFHDTRWTVVAAAGHGDSPEAEAALAKLCRAYWYPLYGFLRRIGHSPEDAKDYTQGFFAQLLEKGGLQKVDRSKGKFRSFLLASLKNFLYNEWDKWKAQKRGGGLEVFSLDQLMAEEQYLKEADANSSPEAFYDKQWAAALVHQVIEVLASEYERSGKGKLFESLRPYLTGEVPEGVYARLGAELKMNENTLKSALHRLRKDDFGRLLREQVRQTLARPSEQEVREEIRHLFASMKA